MKQPFPTLFNRGTVVNRELLNDQFVKTMLFNISKYHTRFVSNMNFLGVPKVYINVLTPDLLTNCVTYLGERQYTIDLEPFINLLLLENPSNVYNIEKILELYNVTRNETYRIIDIKDNVQTFIQDDSKSEIIDDIKYSGYRLLSYYNKTDYVDSNISFDIESTYDLQYDRFLYFMRYDEDRKFVLYQINLPKLGYYLSDNNLSFTDILELLKNPTFDSSIPGIHKFTDPLDFSGGDTDTVDDLTITINDVTKLDNLTKESEIQDSFYFYVNRSETLSIIIDDLLSDQTTATSEELQSNVFLFSNASYLFRRKIFITGQLPIHIENKTNISIRGYGNKSSELNFSEQTFSGTSCMFQLTDCKNVEFADFTQQLYDPEADPAEEIPSMGQGYTQQNSYSLLGLAQNQDDDKYTDNIILRDITIKRLENSIIQVQNIKADDQPHTSIDRVQFVPRGITVVQDIVDTILETGVVDPEIIPSYTLKIGDGTTQRIAWEPESRLNFISSTTDHLTIGFDDVGKKISFTISDIQTVNHTHTISDITSGVLQINRGGTNNTSFQTDKYILFDGTKLASGKTEDEIVNTQLGNINIKVVDQSDAVQFNLMYDSTIKFLSINSDLDITFSDVDNSVSFEAHVPVKSVNTKTGHVELTPQDIGQSQADHNHDQVYLKRVGGTIKPTVDGDQLTVKDQTDSDVLKVNTDTKKLLMYNSSVNFLDIDSDLFNYNDFKIAEDIEGNIVISQGS